MGRLLRASEAAQKLGITVVHLYRLRKAGEITALKIGNRGLRFSEEEIERWLESKQGDGINDHQGAEASR